MHYKFKTGEETLAFSVDPMKENGLKVSTGEKMFDVRYAAITDQHVNFVVDGAGINAFVTGEKGEKTILIRGVPYIVCDGDSKAQIRKSTRDLTRLPQVITPPMPSVVVRLAVAVGDSVQKGDSVIVLTAMKMETTLTSPFSGRVTAVNVSAGEKVMPGKILVDIEKEQDNAQTG